MNVKMALDRRFWAPLNVKLALDLQFWQTGQFRAPVGEAQRTKQVLSGHAGAPARSGAAGRPGRHGWPAGYGHTGALGRTRALGGRVPIHKDGKALDQELLVRHFVLKLTLNHSGFEQLLMVKLALNRRFWVPLPAKMALEWQSCAPLNFKLAVDLQFWPKGQFRAPVGRAVPRGTSAVLEALGPVFGALLSFSGP